MSRFVGGERAVRGCDEACEIEPERGADEQPCIELGGFNLGCSEASGQRTPRDVDGFLHLSSLRKQGPITTGPGFTKIVDHCAPRMDSAVWVPAFAGTTASLLRRLSIACCDNIITPPRLGRRVVQPGARWVWHRSVRPARRRRPPAAVWRA